MELISLPNDVKAPVNSTINIQTDLNIPSNLLKQTTNR